MARISLIAAVGRSGQIGLNGALPWSDPEDLEWFQRMTKDGVLVAGPKTMNTIKHLDKTHGRTLLTDGPDVTAAWLNVVARRVGSHDVWIVGGAATYRKWIDRVDRLYVSRVDYDGDADAWMPDLVWGRGADSLTAVCRALRVPPLGSKVLIDGDESLVATVTGIKFTLGREAPLVECAWMHNGDNHERVIDCVRLTLKR